MLSGRKKRDTRREGSTFMAGLRRSLGEETFDSLMAVHGGVSLIFVIDDTGSMSDEIQATKNITIDIIRQARRNPIQNYILSPFNDPYPDGKYHIPCMSWPFRVQIRGPYIDPSLILETA